MTSIIGRKEEITKLLRLEKSERSEFVAVYGRRRVGKTFLIDQIFGERYTFTMSGVLEGSKTDQLQAFADAFENTGKPLKKVPTKWHDAFQLLRQYIESLSGKMKKIIFIDELPCLDTKRSGLVKTLDHFWNTWASKRNDILLIVCGSATSWMVRNIINNHGGLHDRITDEIHLRQFTLNETEQYLKEHGCRWNRLSITQLYMVMGGVPYYLSLIDPNKSMAQNTDRLFFSEDAPLKKEYRRLYKSLFHTPEKYMKIVELLAKNPKGLSRQEIGKKLEITSNGHLSETLEDLINCDFIRSFRTRDKQIRTNNNLYQLVDFFTIFHYNFCRGRTTDEHYWSNNIETSTENSWHGLAFERVCFAHIPQILIALGVDRIHTEYYSWRSKTSVKPAQIDLIIERADQIVNVCEVKFSKSEFKLTSTEETKIGNRVADFRDETEIKLGIVPTLITTYGLRENTHSSIIAATVTMDQMFE